MNLEERSVARIDSPSIQQGMSADHRVRPLIPPGNWAETDPFLLLMEDWFPEGVFDRHPHRGMETVTYVLDGIVEHYDNHGHEGTIASGDAMWMTAGRGVIHNEQPAAGQTVHLLQLWVNLPRADKLVPAHHQTLHAADLPVRREPGAEVRVFSGRSGSAQAATTNYTPVTMVEVSLSSQKTIQQEIPAGFNTFAVVLTGGGSIGSPPARVTAGQLAWLTPSVASSTVTFSGGENGMRVLLFAGKPLHEPVAARGPFVMNADEELNKGFAEYRSQGEGFGL